MNIDEELIKNKENIQYKTDAEEGYKQILSGEYDLLFLMNPTRLGQIIDITKGDESMHNNQQISNTKWFLV